VRRDIREITVVIDLGVARCTLIEARDRSELNNLDELIQSFQRSYIHCACPIVAEFMSKRYGVSRVSYLHPLLDVDGNDPILPRRIESTIRGMVVSLGNDGSYLKQLMLAYESVAWQSSRGGVVELDAFEFGGGIGPLAKAGTKPLLFDPLNPSSIMNYNFVVLVGGSSYEHVGALNLLWGLAAKYGVPVFVSGMGAAKGIYAHGKSALIVDDTVANWRVALEIVCTNSDYLKTIGLEARELLYFEASIQKKVAVVTQLFGAFLGKTAFYDKFLPL
jgi:hypothetical protein